MLYLSSYSLDLSCTDMNANSSNSINPNSNKNSSIYNVVTPEHPTKEEVLEYQLNKKIISATNREGKIISSQKIQDEFNYEFIYPNPIYF